MITILSTPVSEINRDISVNTILFENQLNPFNVEQYKRLSNYYENLKNAGLIDLIDNGHYFNKEDYDFYFTIGDASTNWYKKLILRSHIIDLVLKHKIINFVVERYFFGDKTPNLNIVVGQINDHTQI